MCAIERCANNTNRKIGEGLKQIGHFFKCEDTYLKCNKESKEWKRNFDVDGHRTHLRQVVAMWQPHYKRLKSSASESSDAPLTAGEDYKRMMDCLRLIVGREFMNTTKLTKDDFTPAE